MININWTNYNLNIHVERIVISLPIELSTEERKFFRNVHRYIDWEYNEMEYLAKTGHRVFASSLDAN